MPVMERAQNVLPDLIRIELKQHWISWRDKVIQAEVWKLKELCIRCDRPTPYDIQTPITNRLYYIEGSGQLCQCH